MNGNFVVVDGSNIATEGRSTPSLAQLDEAVREFRAQFPHKQLIVVVDASFGHRIDSSERGAFEEAASHGELISPPAGAIGRGDAFLLRVAERVGAQVLSNDSFQEFHGQHPWLFEPDRLIGGTPIPGVGWIFVPRSPVKGPRSRAARATAMRAAAPAKAEPEPLPEGTRVAVAEKKQKKKATTTKKPAAITAKTTTEKVPATPAKEKALAAKKSAAKKKAAATIVKEKAAATIVKKRAAATIVKKKAAATTRKTLGGARRPSAARTETAAPEPLVQAALEVATEEVLVPADAIITAAKGTGRRRRPPTPSAINDPLTFLTFVSDHPIGSAVEGTVTSFTSHGAMIDVGPMHCYAPLSGLGKPPPHRARDALSRGEKRNFVLVALDAPRRGAELALAELAMPERARPRRRRGGSGAESAVKGAARGGR